MTVDAFFVDGAGVALDQLPVQDATVTKRFGVSGGSPTTCTTTAATTLYTPASGKSIRLKWLGLSSPDSNSSSTLVTVRIGSTVIYLWDMGAPGAFAHGSVREGAADETLTLSMSVAQTVHANIDVEEF